MSDKEVRDGRRPLPSRLIPKSHIRSFGVREEGVDTVKRSRQPARIVEDDLWFTAIISDLARYTDALASQCCLGRPEFRSILPEYHRGERRIGVRLSKVEECRLRA